MKYNPGVVAKTYNPSTQEAELGGSQVSLGYRSKFQVNLSYEILSQKLINRKKMYC
jgi:hypothetical protein